MAPLLLLFGIVLSVSIIVIAAIECNRTGRALNSENVILKTIPEKVEKQVHVGLQKMEVSVVNGKSQFILIVFGSLDLLTFLLSSPRSFRIISNCLSDMHSLDWVWSLLLIMKLLFGPLAYGFIRRKHWAFVLYYCHFPLRLGFCLGSLSFLQYIYTLLGLPVHLRPLGFYHLLGATVLLGEVARLIITIRLHKKARINSPAVPG